MRSRAVARRSLVLGESGVQVAPSHNSTSALTLPSSGRAKGCALVPPLKCNVRPHMPTTAIPQIPPKPKHPRVDGQITGLAGELFVAAELLKRGLQTSVTFGNAKAIDLFAYNTITKASFNVQVKALRAKNFFLIGHGRIERTHIYVFVLLNKPGQAVQYFIVPGETLYSEPERFAKYFKDLKMPGIHPKVLTELGYENAWNIFGPGAA